jgi:hypothetical protein
MSRERPTSPRLQGFQQSALLSAIKAGTPWQKARLMFPDLPPEYLDAHWFDWSRRAAGLPPAALPTAELPADPVLEDSPGETIVEKVKRKYTKRQ